MNIRLRNIGVIKDSTIKINGLTVITGQNNSGKTTVGKVLYSLVDAVDNIKAKSDNDRYEYAIKNIQKTNEMLPTYFMLRNDYEKIDNQTLRTFFSGTVREKVQKNQINIYLEELIEALEGFNISDEPYNEIISNKYLRFKHGNSSFIEKFDIYKEDAISTLQRTLEVIESDHELIRYAKDSINNTLSIEFNNQIQPAVLQGCTSYIDAESDTEVHFRLEINDNRVFETKNSVYGDDCPYKKAYFIDNPFILDEPAFRKAHNSESDYQSFVNNDRFLTHDNKLKFILNNSNKKSVFEEGIIDEQYSHVKNMIDAVLPGKFIVNDGERFYVNGTTNLNAANLATGSKVFSIMKILLERGEIDKDTLLVLDEPEAHLHPKWQNAFAEIIMILVKEVGCNVLLTTHSSNFMLAIDAYMRKYGMDEKCNFYKTEYLEHEPFVAYKCVNDSLDEIYGDFVQYLTDVKQLRNMYVYMDEIL